MEVLVMKGSEHVQKLELSLFPGHPSQKTYDSWHVESLVGFLCDVKYVDFGTKSVRIRLSHSDQASVSSFLRTQMRSPPIPTALLKKMFSLVIGPKKAYFRKTHASILMEK
jgi:hypothetical protein